MDKKEYRDRFNELQGMIKRYQTNIKALNANIDKLKDDYINENAPYPIGTKVQVVYCDKQGGIEEGIVTGYDCMAYGNITPILHKVKKDGTAHPTAVIYPQWWRDYKLEVTDEQKLPLREQVLLKIYKEKDKEFYFIDGLRKNMKRLAVNELEESDIHVFIEESEADLPTIILKGDNALINMTVSGIKIEKGNRIAFLCSDFVEGVLGTDWWGEDDCVEPEQVYRTYLEKTK